MRQGSLEQGYLTAECSTHEKKLTIECFLGYAESAVSIVEQA